MHTRDFPFGNAVAFYPEATERACTAAILLDVDPVGMVRARGSKAGAEDQYLHFVAARRLARGRLTVIDATNVQPEARRPLVALARAYHVLPVAIVVDMPERVCHERNRSRADRDFGPHVIRQQRSQLHRSLRGLGREGFAAGA